MKAVNKQERAVLAHLGGLRTELYERHFFFFCLKCMNSYCCLSHSPHPRAPLHTFPLEVLPDPHQIRNPKVTSSWNLSQDLTVREWKTN